MEEQSEQDEENEQDEQAQKGEDGEDAPDRYEEQAEEFLIRYDLSEENLEPEINRPLEHTANIGVPAFVRNAFAAYKPCIEIKSILSEAQRKIFAENLIENPKLGPLSELCIRALARANFPITVTPMISENPELVRIYYEELPIDIGMEKMLLIDNEIYWRRFVLEKSRDKSLALKSNVKWKNIGVSLLLVDIVEASSPEYWSNEQMEEMSDNIKDYITEMHLSKLKTQSERTFEEYNEYEHELWSRTSDSDEIPFAEEEAKNNEYINDELEQSIEMEDEGNEMHEKEQIELEPEHEPEVEPTPPPPPPPPKKKKRKKKKEKELLSVFAIPVEDSESEIRRQEDEAEIVDRRNLQKLLDKKRNFRYLTKFCHHIDLSFIRYFDNLEEFTLTFEGEGLVWEFHEKHLKFSYKDMHNLATGLSYLEKLKIFRLRSSRMDARKLKILVRSLFQLPNLETVDFGGDQLKDDCGRWLHDLVSISNSLRFLELEDNKLSTHAMRGLGQAFAKHEGSIIEYLGLARNPIGNRGLHNLVTGLLGTHHVTHLCLTSINITEEAVICCIANELIAQHTPLRRLDLVAIVEMGISGGHRVHSALNKNLNIVEMDCRCCNLEYIIEYEIQLMLERNRYRALCPYVDKAEISDEQVQEWNSRIKDPVLVNALKTISDYTECMANRPDEFERSDRSKDLTESSSSISIVPSLTATKKFVKSCFSSGSSSFVTYPPAEDTQHQFHYDPETFDEKQYLKFMYMPGPVNRYVYFKNVSNRHHHRITRKSKSNTLVFTMSGNDW